MDTVRIARDVGDMTLLLPVGISSFYDLPYNVFDAIRTTLGHLGLEELPKEDRPVKSIWFDGKAMNAHWKMVEARNRVKYGGKADSISEEPIDGPVSRNPLVDEIYA